jgi:hypothetical protein
MSCERNASEADLAVPEPGVLKMRLGCREIRLIRIPRWLLVSLIGLSAIALVAVPAWLWVEMPRRTAAKFVAAVQANDLDRANKLLADATCDFHTYEDYKPFVGFTFSTKAFGKLVVSLSDAKIVPVPRSFRDLLFGEQLLVIRQYKGDPGIKLVASWKHVTSNAEERAAMMESAVPPAAHRMKSGN